MGTRTHLCGTLSESNGKATVTVAGWVDSLRDHGGVVFIDIRDYTGIVQLVFRPEAGADLADAASHMHIGYCIEATGVVTARKPENINPDISTGKVEILVASARQLSASKPLPFEAEDADRVDENVRLKYRYLDLRREPMQYRIRLRHKATQAMRNYFTDAGFCEIETPIMYKSTPEGAKEYIVPSRVHPGQFYALPQSPQVFKQLLMISGFDKYFQIARCFRDEDPRADRQPEFSQLDVEMSFIDEEDIYHHIEQVIARVWKETINIDIPLPLPRIRFQEAMDKYGCDKPDLRFGLELTEITDLVKDCEFGVFSKTVQRGGMVKGLCVEGGVETFGRKAIDRLTAYVGQHGAKGLAFFKVVSGALESGIAKFFKPEEQAAIITAMNAKDGDLLLFVADTPKVTNVALSALRNHLGSKLEMYNPDDYHFTWVVEMPMFEFSEEDNRWVTAHHPFVMPMEPDTLGQDPANERARAYDLVCNGYELGGGSLRIHENEVQQRMFEALQIDPERQEKLFGFLLEALSYGAPPHGGIALGLDRVVMLLCKEENIREVNAFPKTSRATCPLTGSPTLVPEANLTDVHIKVIEQKE